MKQTNNAIKSRLIIDSNGGCAEVARKLGLDMANHNGTRLVYSWYRNGIPSKVQLDNEWLRVK